MINTDMRLYDYFTTGTKNAYGQIVSKPAADAVPEGQIKLAINISSQSIQDHIIYKNCSYVGLTTDKSINDKMVIKYGDELLKVQYVNPKGRFTQVFLKNI